MRRLMLEMSQAHLADALGITFQQAQKYEKGYNPKLRRSIVHLVKEIASAND